MAELNSGPKKSVTCTPASPAGPALLTSMVYVVGADLLTKLVPLVLTIDRSALELLSGITFRMTEGRLVPFALVALTLQP